MYVADAGTSRNRPAGAHEPMMALGPMRWIDHWVGMPACFLLGLFVTAVRRIGLRRSRAISGRGALAVFKFFGLGSILEATPLLRAIRQRYPQAPLVFVTFEGNDKLVRRLGICTDVRVIRTGSPIHFAADVLRQIVWLHRHRVEAVLDLEFFSKFSTLLAFFSGARIRIGFHLNDFWRRSLVTHPVYFNYYRHITDVYRQVGERLDVSITDTQMSRLDPGDEARRLVDEFLRAQGWRPGEPLLGVNINAGDMCPERRWPVERFAELIEALLATRPNLRIVLTGSPDEQPHVSSLVDRLSAPARERTITTAGRWRLDEFIAALPLFRAFLSNDSGPMHFAAAEGVPMVSLWGPGRPAFYAPHYADHRTIYADYPCSPCLYMFTTFEAMWCRHEGWCMQAIDVDTVLRAVESMLTRAPS